MWANSSLSPCILRADLSFKVRYPGVTFKGLRNTGSLGRAELWTAWAGISGSLGDCKVATRTNWEGFPFSFFFLLPFLSLIMGEGRRRVLALLGMSLPQTYPLPPQGSGLFLAVHCSG